MRCSSEKKRQYNKTYAALHPERGRQYRAQWRKANYEKVARQSRITNLRIKYGISIEEYTLRVAQQNNRCAICNQEEQRTRSGHVTTLSVDHNHTTGQIRQLLCNNCNQLLGYAHDSATVLETAAAYLRKFEKGSSNDE